MEALDAGELDEAERVLNRLRDEFGETRHGQQATLEQAYVSYRQGDLDKAIALVSQYIERRPEANGEDLAYALFLRASAAHALWDAQQIPPDTSLARQAFGYYRELVERFPEDKRVEEALRQMNRLRSDLAAEELRQARQKMAAGDYVQAAERAAWVAEQYPGQREAGDALALQAEALERLGRPREAEATRRMLEIKHPEHPAVSQD